MLASRSLSILVPESLLVLASPPMLYGDPNEQAELYGFDRVGEESRGPFWEQLMIYESIRTDLPFC